MTLAQVKDIAQDTIPRANHLGKTLSEYIFLESGIHVLSFSETWLHAPLPDSQFYLGNHYTLLH